MEVLIRRCHCPFAWLFSIIRVGTDGCWCVWVKDQNLIVSAGVQAFIQIIERAVKQFFTCRVFVLTLHCNVTVVSFTQHLDHFEWNGMDISLSLSVFKCLLGGWMVSRWAPFIFSASDSCSGVCNVEEQERRVYLKAHIYSSYCLALELQRQCPGQTRSLSCPLGPVHLCLQGHLSFVISGLYSSINTHSYSAILC